MSFGGGGGSGGSLSTDSDVVLNSPSDGQVLGYSGGSNKWTNQTVSAGGAPGVVQLDSFSGADDDTKLDNALAYAAAQTYIPAIQFPARLVRLSKTRTPFSGMKLIGPFGNTGPKNLELSSGSYVNHQVAISCGTDTSSWFYGTGTYYDVLVSGLAFKAGNSNSQFWHQPSGHLYACRFENLDFSGWRHIFGSPTAKAMMWQVIFSGHWTANGCLGTAFTIGGSDCAFWRDGYGNIGGSSSMTTDNTYLVVFDALQKTSVGYMYLTSNVHWGCLNVKDWTSSVSLFGGSYEGFGENSAWSNGSLIKIDNGMVDIRSPWLAFGMNNPTTGNQGIIQVNGGNVVIDRPIYEYSAYNGGSADASVPVLYVTGGKAVIRDAVGLSNPYFTPVVGSSGGTLTHDASVSVA